VVELRADAAEAQGEAERVKVSLADWGGIEVQPRPSPLT
jgi:hypothetical protein